jgi:site-specific recombinase XerD
MRNVLLVDVIRRTRSILQACQYKDSVLKRFEIEFRKIEGYFSRCGQTYFCEDMLKRYLGERNSDFLQHNISKVTYYRIRSAAGKLFQCVERDLIVCKRMPILRQDDQNAYNDPAGILRAYNSYLDEQDRSHNTKKNYLRISKLFMRYAAERGHLSLRDVSREDIVGFIPHISQRYRLGSMSAVLTALRSFFQFAQCCGYCDWDMSQALPRTSAAKTVVYAPLTTDEEASLLQSMDRTTSAGKRDYALVLLIMRTGLRTVDIMNLQINDLDWRRNTITLIQQKTGRPLVLPLLPDVGNAIAEYLLNGRPKTEDQHVFLRNYPPYIGFQNPYSCSLIIKRLMERAEIGQSQYRRAHALRHSLACRLLHVETPVTVISSILGHSNKDSTKVYLSTHVEQLRTCALTLQGIAVTRGALS